MDLCADKSDFWVRVLGALGESSPATDANDPVSGCASCVERHESTGRARRRSLDEQNASVFSPCVTINVLECFDGVAMIEWVDPTAGHYAEQRWQRSVAKRGGICALSGDAIVRGDYVFRPVRKVPEPMNSRAMILASALPVVQSL